MLPCMTDDLDDAPGFLTRQVIDPDGVEFSVDVVPTYGSTSKVFLGRVPGVPVPIVRGVNRLVSAVQREPEQVRFAMVTVSRIRTQRHHREVHHVRADDFEHGRAVAEELVAQIEAGTFSPSGT